MKISAQNNESGIVEKNTGDDNVKTQNVEVQQQKSKNIEETNTEKPSAELKSQDNTGAKVKSRVVNPSSNNSKKNQDTRKHVRNPDEPILQSMRISEEFKEISVESTPMEKVMIYSLYGLVSGGLMGLGGGLSFYTTSTELTPLYVSAGAMGAAGILAGVLITIIENTTKNPLLGNELFLYSWYGAAGGAALGAVIGLIPYSSSTDIASLLNWVGYGTFVGAGVGIALFAIMPKTTLKNLIFDINPLQSRIGYIMKF